MILLSLRKAVTRSIIKTNNQLILLDKKTSGEICARFITEDKVFDESEKCFDNSTVPYKIIIII